MSKKQVAKAKEQEERPITLRWTELSGSQYTFQSSDDGAIQRKYNYLFLRYVENKIRGFRIEH